MNDIVDIVIFIASLIDIPALRQQLLHEVIWTIRGQETQHAVINPSPYLDVNQISLVVDYPLPG